MLVEEVKPGDGRITVGPGGGGTNPPGAVEIGARAENFCNRALGSKDFVHQVVDGHELVLQHRHRRVPVRQDVVTRAGPGLRMRCQEELVPEGCNEVDRDLDTVGLAPAGQDLPQRIIRARHPMIEDSQLEFAG